MPQTDDEVLKFHRRFEAPPEAVFEVLTTASHMENWLVRSNAKTNVVSDPRPGGMFRIILAWPDGSEIVYSGEYLELDPPRKLMFSFYPGRKCPLEQHTMVTMELVPDGKATRLYLEHRLAHDPDNHFQKGWTRLWKDFGLAFGTDDDRGPGGNT